VKHVRERLPPMFHFGYEMVRDARMFGRPVNHAPVHITTPASGPIDPKRRPYVIIDRAHGTGPGIGGVKDDSALRKLADRGRITGGVLDGPLPFNNAVSEEAARAKKIVSPAAGQADILLEPDLEAGNLVANQLEDLARADCVGIVVGTRVPIVLTSRADNVRTRFASTAVMALVADARREKPPAGA
jgi:phosphate acetyltransferase